jgi:hypothetical protein
MNRLLILAVPVLALFSCAKDSSNPVNTPAQPLSTTMVFGQQKVSPLDGAIQFVPLPYQNSTNFQYLDLTQQATLSIQVTEHGVHVEGASSDRITFDPSKIIFHLTTKYDKEGFQGDVNCLVDWRGYSWSQDDEYISFEARIPVALATQIVQNNGRIEFTGNEDDYFVVHYVSPYSGLILDYTVKVTKNI